MSRGDEVAVVVPVYNGWAMLPTCLESILAQSVRPRVESAVADGQAFVEALGRGVVCV